MTTGLVLGGGGLVGMGYHAGVLQALDDAGVDAGAADILVGTSAGSVIASYLAAGWATSDFYEYGMGRHPKSVSDPEGQRREVRDIFIPLYGNRAERVRRGVGSLFAVAAARGFYRAGLKGKVPAGPLRKAFPAGMYSTQTTKERLHDDLPSEWPRDGLFISTAELYSGKRVVFGAEDAPPASLPEAVLASTAIPGVFPPVRIGDRQYVDGGIVSGTSLDLAADAGCTSILCVAPLGYRIDDPTLARDPRMWSPMFVRAMFARKLRTEVRAARSRGIDVLVLRPLLSELKTHGTNSMRQFDRTGVMESAREATHRILEEHVDHPAIAALRTDTTQPREARRA